METPLGEKALFLRLAKNLTTDTLLPRLRQTEGFLSFHTYTYQPPCGPLLAYFLLISISHANPSLFATKLHPSFFTLALGISSRSTIMMT